MTNYKMVLIAIATAVLFAGCADDSNQSSASDAVVEKENVFDYEELGIDEYQYGEDFKLGENLKSAMEVLATYGNFNDEFVASDDWDQWFIDSFINSMFDGYEYKQQLLNEQDGLMTKTQVEYVQYSLTGQYKNLETIEKEIDCVKSPASPISSYRIENYTYKTDENTIVVKANCSLYRKGRGEEGQYIVTANLVKNPYSCFDGYSIISISEKDEAEEYVGILNSTDEINVEDVQAELRYIDYNNLFNDYTELTLCELISHILEATDLNYDEPTLDDVEYSLIDCGNDGYNECCIRIPFICDGSYYEVICVISSQDETYYLRYMTDEGQKDYVTIDKNGYVTNEMNTDYGTCTEYSILNSTCENESYYTLRYYLTADNYKKVKSDVSNIQEIQVEEFSLSNDECYCCYFELDENNNKLNENDEKYRKIFEQEGVKILSESEIREKLINLKRELEQKSKNAV